MQSTPVSTTFTSSDIESLPSSSTSPSTSSTLSTPSKPTPPATHEKLKRYVEFCKSKAYKYGFHLQTEVYQVLGSKNIILFKKRAILLRVIQACGIVNHY